MTTFVVYEGELYVENTQLKQGDVIKAGLAIYETHNGTRRVFNGKTGDQLPFKPNEIVSVTYLIRNEEAFHV
jgi:hypothetical protein